MKKFTKQLMLLAAAVLLGIVGHAQTVGDYRTAGAGPANWSNPASWQFFNGSWGAAATAPGATDPVFIEAGHTITVDGNQACANLNISTTGIVSVGTNTLTVNGKLRCYLGAAPGASNTSPGPLATAITNTTGRTVFTLADSITKVGEWAANTHSWRAEFAISGGGIASLGTNFKAGDIIISNGTVSTSSDIRPDFNAVNTGNLTINTGSRLRFTGGGNIRRTGTTGTNCASATIDGTLEYNGLTGTLFALTKNNNGTVVYSRGSSQFLCAQLPSYRNLVLSGSGDRIDTIPISIQNNGTVTLSGSATAVFKTQAGTVNTGSITYGTNGTLIVSSTSGFYNLNGHADFFHVWPATNGPTNLTVSANTFRVNSPSFDRTIPGTLTLNGGNMVVRDTASLRFGNNATIVRTNGALRTAASNPSGLSGMVYHGLSATDKVNIVMEYTDTARAEFPSNDIVGPGSIGTVTINNAANYIIALGNKTTDNIVFNSGKILLVDDTLTVNNTITGASASNYIVTDAPLEALEMAVGSSPIVFPVGPSASLYHPATITNAGTADNFFVNVSAAAPPCAPNNSVAATWDIGEETPGGSSCTLSLDFTGAATTGTFVPADAKLVHCTGTTVDYVSGSVTGNVATGSGFTTFSPFGITSDLILLPVTLRNFSATRQQATVQLMWVTEGENNNSGFEVQRSLNGTDFTPLQFVATKAANGNSALPISYGFTDVAAPASVCYYRLKQMDRNQQAKMSQIVKVQASTTKALTLHATMAGGSNGQAILTIHSPKSQRMEIALFDITGRLIMSENQQVHAGVTQLYVGVEKLAPGIITVVGTTATEKTIGRFLK
jgi:hypothetical protein